MSESFEDVPETRRKLPLKDESAFSPASVLGELRDRSCPSCGKMGGRLAVRVDELGNRHYSCSGCGGDLGIDGPDGAEEPISPDA